MSGAPRARANDQRYFGLVEALVSSVDDPEKEGRIKVTFPWFDPDMESDWCRVAQLYGGAGGKGSIWVPDKGDEVICGMVHGDMRKVVVLGCLFNGADRPPTHPDDPRDRRMIKTRAGHTIVLEDKAGEEHVEIKTQGGHVADLNDKDKKVVVKTTSGQAVTMDDNGGTVTVETASGQSVKLDSSGVTITGTSSVSVSAPSIKLGAAATEPVILGQQFLTYFMTHTHNCTAPGTPSGPPVPPMLPTLLSTVTKTG
jgi:uncharacterized protein involved in type VI secretion and phage assembly